MNWQFIRNQILNERDVDDVVREMRYLYLGGSGFNPRVMNIVEQERDLWRL